VQSGRFGGGGGVGEGGPGLRSRPQRGADPGFWGRSPPPGRGRRTGDCVGSCSATRRRGARQGAAAVVRILCWEEQRGRRGGPWGSYIMGLWP